MTEGALLEVVVWRGNETGEFQTFAIPRREHQTALDVVTEIQRHGRERPAALNRAWTLVNDVRDRGEAERMDAVSGGCGWGCRACHTHMSCTEFYPKDIEPTYSIAGLKRAMVKRALEGGA